MIVRWALMRKKLALSIVALALLADVSATSHRSNQQAASRPNFSGAWTGIPPGTPEPARSPGELVASFDWYSLVTLTQTETSLTVEYRSYDRSHALRNFVYKLDGTKTTNVLTGSVDPQGRTSSATWEGMTLVLTDAVDWPNRAAGTTQKRLDRKILSLESPEIMRVEAWLTLGDRNSAPTVVRFRRTR